jgi:hypothetical protein
MAAMLAIGRTLAMVEGAELQRALQVRQRWLLAAARGHVFQIRTHSFGASSRAVRAGALDPFVSIVGGGGETERQKKADRHCARLERGR